MMRLPVASLSQEMRRPMSAPLTPSPDLVSSELLPMLLSRHRRWMRHAGVVVAVLIAMPAHAQLGGLRRAVERRVEQKAEDRVGAANLIPPTFDATTIEITTERLDRYQAAMEKFRTQRNANRARYEQMMEARSATADSAQALESSPVHETYRKAVDTYRDCRSDVSQAADAESERRAEELTARMQRDPVGMQSDPKVREILALMQTMAAAQQRGDTAALFRAQQRYQAVMGGAGDSASLDRAATPKCGARPIKPPVVVRQEALAARAESLRKAADALMSASGGVKGAEVGMTDVQAKMFWERIQSWLNGMQQNAVITRTFTQGEYDLLVSRRDALRRVFSGSE